MRNDMGALLFKGSGVKVTKARKRLDLRGRLVLDRGITVEVEDNIPARPRVVVMDFRLGDEPEGKVLRHLSVRAGARYGWVTAEVMLPVVARQVRKTTGPNDQAIEEQVGVDDAPSSEPMRPRHSRYCETDTKINLGVLKRFLGTRVGRNWGVILGEMRRGCDSRSYQGHTLEQCARGMVATNVELVGDELHDVEFRCTLEESPRRFRYFVHPVTGLLQHMPRQTKSAKQKLKQAEVERPEQVDIDAATKLVRVAGIWYVVGFKPIPTMDEVRRQQPSASRDELTLPKDIILGKDAVNDPDANYCAYGRGSKLSNYTVDSLRDAWGAEIYAVSKRQAGRRELKRYVSRRRAA